MSKTLANRSLANRRLAVVAPLFPAINQPWIDTYLEQLINNGFEPLILTQNASPSKYGSKVDKLNLREKSLLFSDEGRGIAKALVTSGRGLYYLLNAFMGVRCFSTSIMNRLKLAMFAAWLKGLGSQTSTIELVHSHDESSAYLFLGFCEVAGIPLILTFHGLPPAGVKQLSKEKREALYSKVACVIVNTEFAKRQVCSLGCKSDKVAILPQGLSLDEFPFRYHRPPPDQGHLRLLTVGRFHRDKGQQYGLLALKRLIDRGFQAQYTLVGVGEGVSRLKRLAERLGVLGNITFVTGKSTEELKEFYYQSHVFVFPSIDTPGGPVETQGVVLQEAQATGCIPVASRTGGIVECLNHGCDALLVKQQSSRELCEAIVWLLERPEVWEKFQQNGRLNVERNYSSEIIGEKMAALLENVITDKNGGKRFKWPAPKMD